MVLDIAASCEGFRELIILDIGLICSADNLADGLTKSMAQAALQKAISSGSITVSPE